MTALAEVFPYQSHKYRVMSLTKAKDKASVAFYIDARDVMDRLDETVGPDNWHDMYHVLNSAGGVWVVECCLTVNGVTKCDVGEGDGPNAPKEAYSDALKRAAVKHGIGRYLYGMDTSGWYPVDDYKNFTSESVKRIEALLQRNLTQLTGKMYAVPVNGNKEDTKERAQRAPAVVDGNDGEDVSFYRTPVDNSSSFNPYAEIADHPDYEFSDSAKWLIAKVRQAHASSGEDGPMSTVNKDGTGSGQYGLLAGVIDGHTEKDAHGPILSCLLGRDVSKANPPGYKVKGLVDWCKKPSEKYPNDKYDERIVGIIQEVWAMCQLIETETA